MAMTMAISASIVAIDGIQYIPLTIFQEAADKFRLRLAAAKKKVEEKDRILTEMSKQLLEAQTSKWRMQLDKVSFKKVSTPQKQILEALKDHPENAPVRVELLANQIGMHRATIQRQLNDMEAKQLLTRRYENSGNDLYIDLNQDILRNPGTIEKIVPVDRSNWGGARVPSEKPRVICPECGLDATETSHIAGQCANGHAILLNVDCTPYGSTATQEADQDQPGEFAAAALAIVSTQQEPPRELFPEPPPPPRVQIVRGAPQRACMRCGERCWVQLEEDGITWWDCGCVLDLKLSS